MSTILYLSNQLVQAVETKGKRIGQVCQEMAPEGSIINGIITDEEIFQDWLRQFFLKNKLPKKECKLVINSTQINTRVLDLPKTRSAEILKMITREFADIRSLQTIFSYHVLGNDAHDKLQKILAVAVEREFLVSYLKLFAQAGIEVTCIEPAITVFVRRFGSIYEVQRDNSIIQVKDGQEILSMLFAKGTYLYSQRNRVFNEKDMKAFAQEAEAVVGRLQQFASTQRIEGSVETVFICGSDQSELKEAMEDNTNLPNQMKLKLYRDDRGRIKKKTGIDFLYPVSGYAKQDSKLNFAKYVKQDRLEEEKKREKAILALPAGVVFLICMLITIFMGSSWIKYTAEISRFQKAIDNPDAISAHTAFELADASVEVMEKKIERAKVNWDYLMSYPTLDDKVKEMLTNCAGNDISLEIVSFSRDNGMLTMNASTRDAGYISDFIGKLQEQECIQLVEYGGYTWDRSKNRYYIHVVCALSEGAGR